MARRTASQREQERLERRAMLERRADYQASATSAKRTPVQWAVGEAADQAMRVKDDLKARRTVWVPIQRFLDAMTPGTRLDPKTLTGGPNAIGDRVQQALFHWSEGGHMDPALAYVRGGRVHVEDGRHRLVAAYQAGERWAPVLADVGDARALRSLVGARDTRPAVTGVTGTATRLVEAGVDSRLPRQMLDAFITMQARHAINPAAVAQALGALDDIQEELLDRASALARGSRSRQRMEAAVSKAKAAYTDAAATLVRTTESTVLEVVLQQQDEARAILKNTLSVVPGADISLAAITPSQLQQAVTEEPFAGWATKDYIKELGDVGVAKVDRTLRAAWLSGDSIEQLRQRLQVQVADISQWTRSRATVLARTAIQTSANAAARSLYEANQDILSGYRVIATLDTRTCPVCGNYDGRLISFSDTRTPRPPYHHQCRCFLQPEVRKDILPFDDPPPETWTQWVASQRAATTWVSSRGNVLGPGTMPKPQKLAVQKPTWDLALGKGVAALLRSGAIQVSDLHTGGTAPRPRTLAELNQLARRRRSAA